MTFSCNIISEQPVFRLDIAGSFTLDSNAVFRDVLVRLSHAQPDYVEVNMAGVTDVDSAGMSMLVLLHDEAQSRQLSVSLRGMPEHVDRMTHVVGIRPLFRIAG